MQKKNQKLSSLKTFQNSFQYIFQNGSYLLKLSLIPWVFILSGWLLVYHNNPHVDSLLSGGVIEMFCESYTMTPSLVCAFLLEFIGLVLFEVHWLNLILKGEKLQKLTDIFQWKKREWLYTGASLILYTAISPILIIGYFSEPQSSTSFDIQAFLEVGFPVLIPIILILIAMIALLVMFFVALARLFFMFPSAVLEKSINPSLSWKNTKGMAWTLFFGLCLVSGLYFTLTYLLSLSIGYGYIALLIAPLISILQAAIFVEIIGQCYKYKMR